jgi:hypothetical protein
MAMGSSLQTGGGYLNYYERYREDQTEDIWLVMSGDAK